MGIPLSPLCCPARPISILSVPHLCKPETKNLERSQRKRCFPLMVAQYTHSSPLLSLRWPSMPDSYKAHQENTTQSAFLGHGEPPREGPQKLYCGGSLGSSPSAGHATHFSPATVRPERRVCLPPPRPIMTYCAPGYGPKVAAHWSQDLSRT